MSVNRSAFTGLRFKVTTKQEGIAVANYFVENNPDLKTVEDVIDQWRKANPLIDETSVLIVWGRLSRLLPFRA